MAAETVMPEVLYVQKGIYNSINEVVVNQTPEGALRRDLGTAGKPGEHVGIYKLDRIVQIKIGVTEVPQDPTPTTQ